MVRVICADSITLLTSLKGATPELKFQTIVSRLTQSHVQPSLLFFRTSPASRSTPRFLHESRIIPPLVYPTCIRALRTILETSDALEIHYADEEGDSYAVELAGRVGGFVVGNDSDFVILGKLSSGSTGECLTNSQQYIRLVRLSGLHPAGRDGVECFYRR
jgi:hypothetical protein